MDVVLDKRVDIKNLSFHIILEKNKIYGKYIPKNEIRKEKVRKKNFKLKTKELAFLGLIRILFKIKKEKSLLPRIIDSIVDEEYTSQDNRKFKWEKFHIKYDLDIYILFIDNIPVDGFLADMYYTDTLQRRYNIYEKSDNFNFKLINGYSYDTYTGNGLTDIKHTKIKINKKYYYIARNNKRNNKYDGSYCYD